MASSAEGGEPNPVPDEYIGIQVNFCRNPTCANFGVPASPQPAARGPGAQNVYTRIGGGGRLEVNLKCHACGSAYPIKSNRGIFEELVRMETYLHPAARPSCRTPTCPNYGEPAPDPARYQSHGRTKSGKPRFECRACGRTFSSKARTRRSPYSDNEPWIFRHLLNKVPFRRTAELNQLFPHTLYRKIDLIHRKCAAFAAEHERKLPHMTFERLYLSTDRQMFAVNWSSRRDRTNTMLASIATADNISRYVFGAHLNFDPTVDADAAEADAISNGEILLPPYLRHSARILLQADQLRKAARKGRKPKTPKRRPKASMDGAIISRPPDYGAQISDPYVIHAHFEFLRRLLARCRTFRFYLDPDPGLWPACLAMFHREVATNQVEAFVVQIQKNLTRPEREKTIAEAWALFEVYLTDINDRIARGEKLGELRETAADQIIADWEADLVQPTPEDIADVFARRQAMTKRERRKAAQDKQARDVEAFVRRLMIRAAMKRLRANKKGEFWLKHPMPRLDEPMKTIWRLTDRGSVSGLSDDSIAHLYDRASLHAIDNYFQLARRNFSALERAPNTARRGRLHYIYMPFDPMTVVRLLDMHRVHFNFVKTGRTARRPPCASAWRTAPIRRKKSSRRSILSRRLRPPSPSARRLRPHGRRSQPSRVRLR